ncbi:hypothetical protein EQ500_14260 [Lactobacillus sp. XV13L]|nr:hypothetical protein [Lactobacillus sp. XV13L]
MVKKFAIIALTTQGTKTARLLSNKLLTQTDYQVQVFVPSKFADSKEIAFGTGEFTRTIEEQFK